MTYRGHIKNGVAVLDSELRLPEGTPVRVEVDGQNATFWSSKNIEQLAQEQGVKPLGSLEELAGDWPPDESLDDFVAFIREARH